MQKRIQKGFTLAELLIVVAIIGVLVAVAVPVFTGSLNKARLATDMYNERAARSLAAGYVQMGAYVDFDEQVQDFPSSGFSMVFMFQKDGSLRLVDKDGAGNPAGYGDYYTAQGKDSKHEKGEAIFVELNYDLDSGVDYDVYWDGMS